MKPTPDEEEAVRTRIVLATFAVALVAAACSRSAEPELSATTSSLVGAAVTSTTTTVAASEGDDTTTTTSGQQVESFEVAVRESTDDGEILYVVVPPGSYTDLDLEDFIVEMVESNPGLYELHVVDDPDAVVALRTPADERTDEQQSLLEAHHLVSLVEGKLVRFQGPFAEMGEFVLGS